MKVRFYFPHAIVFSSHEYPPQLREVVQLLNGSTAELADAIDLIRMAAPNAEVGALDGFIAMRNGRLNGPIVLIRFEGVDADAHLFRTWKSVRTPPKAI